MPRSIRFLVLLLAAFALPLSAATYVVPSDAEMIQTSDDIVIATAVSAAFEYDAHGSIVTRSTLRVVETLKGDRAAGEHLVVTELGGAIGDAAEAVAGSPEYEPGVRYLVFTSTNAAGDTITFGMSLGQFRLVDDLAIRREIRGFDRNLEPYSERARDARRFEAYIRDTVAQRGAAADYFVANARETQIAAEWKIAANAFTRTSYLLQNPADGKGFRWQTPTVHWVRAGTQSGTANGPAAVSTAFSQWNSTATNIELSDEGVDPSALGGFDARDGKDAILFGDPNHELPSSIAGKGGVKASGQHSAGGETFWSAAEADVVIANMNFGQSCLNTIMTHEVGHALGFRHANIPSPGEVCGSTAQCSSSAVMNSTALCGFNGVLQAYDLTAAETVYGGGGTTPTCPAPSITNQPGDQTINPGQIAVLSLGASGVTVKWYRGTVGDRSSQVGTTGSVIVGPLTATTKYWAEVSNACGALASRQITVTVRALPVTVPMLGGRFSVQVRYKNQFDNNKQGNLLGRSLFTSASSETAVFTFEDPNVVELLVRVSDARPFDNHIHVFLGGLSDVELFVIVSDSVTGTVREYRKPANQLVGIIDRTTYPAAGGGGQGAGDRAVIAPPIESDAETSTVKLLNGRFQVRMRYRNPFSSPATTGYLNARSVASTSTTETAVFFFGENAGSAEWMVRFSDARPFANRIDMFHGGLSDVELTIEVFDTKTGVLKEYAKGAFSLAGQVDRTSYKP